MKKCYKCQRDTPEADLVPRRVAARGRTFTALVCSTCLWTAMRGPKKKRPAKRPPCRRPAPRPQQLAPLRVRLAIYRRDDFACVYCGSGLRLTLDHLTPRSRGGADTPKNFLTACWPCNRRRGSQILEDFCGKLRAQQLRSRAGESLSAHLEWAENFLKNRSVSA